MCFERRNNELNDKSGDKKLEITDNINWNRYLILLNQLNYYHTISFP